MRNDWARFPKRNHGSVTLEAAIAFPVFLCVLISILFLIKVVYTYGLIQHALTETADEMASMGYIFRVSGMGEVHDTLREGMRSRAEVFEDHLGTVFDTYNSIASLGSGASGQERVSGDDSRDTDELLAQARGNFDRMVEAAEDAASDPVEELKNIACFIASGAFEEAKTELFTPVTRLLIKKYLVTEQCSKADLRLRKLNISDGFRGLDFSHSSFLEDEREEIVLVVRYEIDLPLPVKILPPLVMEQRASARAWMEGDEPFAAKEDPGQLEDNLWSLGNLQRGSIIRQRFGANLPYNFPVIAAFSNGKATMIKSMDLTAESYRNPRLLARQLEEYIRILARFKGQEEPWGSRKILIREEDIRSRELLLVIPSNPLSEVTEALLDQYVEIADAQGITLKIERYGYKKTETDSSESPPPPVSR